MSGPVVVWGATGFIGRAVVEQLVAKGVVVRGISRSGISIPENWQGKYEHYCHDFCASRSDLLKVMQGASCTIHCAGHFNAQQDLLNEFENSVANFAGAALEAGVKRVILLSSLALYGRQLSGAFGVKTPASPDSPYGESRARAEELARKLLSGTTVTLHIVRIPAVIGTGMKSIVLTGLFKTLKTGIFLHPGSLDSCLACVGIKRLAIMLSGLAVSESLNGIHTIQVVENLKWADLVTEYRRTTGDHVIRLALPGRLIIRVLRAVKVRVPGPLFALASEAIYENNAEEVPEPVFSPSTMDEVREIIRGVRVASFCEHGDT